MRRAVIGSLPVICRAIRRSTCVRRTALFAEGGQPSVRWSSTSNFNHNLPFQDGPSGPSSTSELGFLGEKEAAEANSDVAPLSSPPSSPKQQRAKRGAPRLRRRGGTPKRRQARDAPPPPSDTAVEYDADMAASLPRGLDTSAVEDLIDVERFFPRAVAHLKATPRSPDAAEASRARRWHDITHHYNVDNIVTPAKLAEKERHASGQHSFFDEGGLDVRGGMIDKLRSGRYGGARDETERLSPDVLHLTGGSARRHGSLRLAAESNAAPADQTIEGDRGDFGADREFGDTPVQLTDMLRERLMELKAESLKEERNETFLPHRLRHVRAGEELLQLAKRGEGTPALPTRQSPTRPRSTTSLADLAPEEAEEGGEEQRGLGPDILNVPDKAILRDGVAPEKVAQAAQLAHRSDALVPGASQYDPLQRLAKLAAQAQQRVSASDEGRNPTGATEGVEGLGLVHLLRTLPRAGFCSRREASAIIASGQVRVNNVVERNPFRLVRAEDDVHVSGHESRLRFSPPRLWMYHKPANVIVSRNDVAGRTLITKHARILGMDHLVPIGSLPMRAHGILLLTNDGELSRFLENPQSMVQRTYLLRVRPAMDPVLVHKLNTEGIQINGRCYRNAEFFVNPATKSRYSVKVKVRGESMPIAHLMQHLGRTVERGGRISFGPFALSGLAVGSLREVTVPPFYMQHLGSAWQPFVERDWPYFRRQRVSRLRRLCRHRELTPRELEELDNYTYEEVKDALSFESTELESLAEQRAQQLRRAQLLDEELPPLPREFLVGTGDHRHRSSGDISTGEDVPYDDAIVEDITAVL
ncbi:putative mitochondrial tRNA pseudouridine synthase A [Leptomonas pyrrhocoris]|uniref:Putative mitochondrial tRNA pseudouridine synthase A n=1 Tax=Leptomonas pyrrhocoris TaxID=157538 RepID=A0A0N0DVB2_LEPPY|nr:putative mitochondrial tRNA pseudouridine synthase A [Leptomonas pyrrhocoris]KPA80092.1 putative mitochondrial tRNA pseudouridine synthase A [Leptomonas pyrrhocoris]|eukprot:XP_015658531.1 putative mitochondrial tRNA pseudouridine synthase A [Leptomonas pyrrhocoris]